MEINIKPPVLVQCPGRTRSPVLVKLVPPTSDTCGGGAIVSRPRDLIIPRVTFRSSLFLHRRFPGTMIFFGELSPAGLNCNCKLKLFFMSSLLLPPPTPPKKDPFRGREEPTSAARFYEITEVLFLARGKGTIIFISCYLQEFGTFQPFL